ncbi:MAG: tRNA 2-thiouridine(34) synthase MnmA, partial [Clostridia bacterium]|nr:tRNA 2-thiouridine(34) synthase MnmA [Clostridia bacterium]
MKSVYVGMSGGVDSSVAALLLKQEGYDVTGFTLDLWGESSDYSDIKELCDHIGIKHEIISIRDEFKSKVVEPFLDEYKNARTPNPCVFCNKHIKFGYMIDYIADKADYVATGHYAKVIHNEKTGRYYFEKSADEGKDQTYMFYTLSQEQISKILMPLGKYKKSEIREIAKKYGIKSADAPDSQDICFLEGKDLTTFIKENAPDQFKPGDIVNKNGDILGKHNGISCYTMGQRRGLGVASEKRIYVVEINADNNTVVLDEEKY